MKALGEILLDEGLVTEGQLMAALDEQVARGQSLGRTLVEIGVLGADFVADGAVVNGRKCELAHGVTPHCCSLMSENHSQASGCQV